MSSNEVRLWQSPDGAFCRTYPGMNHTHTALPAEQFGSMASDARAYRCLLQALKTGENAKLTFGQVMADLGLDDPDGQPRVMEVRFGRK